MVRQFCHFLSRRKEKARGVVTFLSPLVVFSPDVGVDFLPLSVVVGGMLSDVGGWELVPYVSLHSSRQLCLYVSSDRSLFSPLTRLVNVHPRICCIVLLPHLFLLVDDPDNMFQCIIQPRNGWIHPAFTETKDVFPGRPRFLSSLSISPGN